MNDMKNMPHRQQIYGCPERPLRYKFLGLALFAVAGAAIGFAVAEPNPAAAVAAALVAVLLAVGGAAAIFPQE